MTGGGLHGPTTRPMSSEAVPGRLSQDAPKVFLLGGNSFGK